MEKRRPVLSVSMLVSNNRRDTIEKCMESLVPLLKAVPSELIIVDTGCTDGSVDIARRYADKVVEFTWCKDFSAARNTGLRECTGEWFLYLDDDEWFEDVSELIEFFKSEERQICDALWYIQRNYDNFEGTAHTDAYVGRCVKLTPETEFLGKIHEYLFPHPKMIKKTNAYVHHYGYVFKSEEDRLKHLERNLTLEEEAVRENPDDVRMCCQLVQEYWVARRFDEALKLAKETLERSSQLPTDSFVQYLWLVIPRLYKGREDNERALKEFARLEKDYVLMHQTKLGLYYERAMTYGAMKREEDLIKEFFRYLIEFMVSPKKDAPVEHPIMDFAQYQSVSFYCKAVELMVTNMICGDLYGYAEAIYDRMDWTQTSGPKEMLVGLFRCYEETGNANLLRKHLPAVLQLPELQGQVYGTLHELYERYPAKRGALLTDLEELNMRSGNLAYFHLLYTEQKGITTEQDIADYYEKSDRKYDAEVALLFLTKAKLKLQMLTELNKMGSIEASVKEYVRWARSYTEAVTEEGAWNRGELPQELPELWFARVMEFTFEVEDMAEYGGLLKEALSYCPVFLPTVKALLAEREMVTLAAQVKTAVKMQLAAGKPEEAKVMLAELATMVPWDAEVSALLREPETGDEPKTGSIADEDGRKRKEVVFLPYKASMWDSLESIWRAAEADPECDAYVVPIPYYDKNPDGSFKQMHYEGNLYPPEVPVIWYEDYDFAARKPDVIFIHNPYDECNYVTSVEPAFYSPNLKKYTDKLVYIPYFVLGELDPENEEAVEKMSHFCTLPGVMNADTVVVQSENMRQAYIKVLTDFAGAHTKKSWEEKILGLGSPKFDKVAEAQKEKFTVPEEWKRVLLSSTRERKKIILYNTTITAILEHGEVMLDKMERVFQSFYERREEIVLWWRPHPLISSTLMAMRPTLWNRYNEIVEKYKEEGWGIYDDTSELDRALVLSDAYYGDGSSLVQLYEKTGKPIMIQNCTIQ